MLGCLRLLNFTEVLYPFFKANLVGIYLQKLVSCANDQLHSLTIFYGCDSSSIQTNLFPTESDVMKCDIQYSGVERLDLCSGKLKLINPAVDFPLCAQP